MNFETILNGIPDYAKDIKLNFSSMINNHAGLTDSQFAGAVLVAAIATKNGVLTKYVHQAVLTQLADNEFNAVHAAAAIMGMTNIYYRFTDLVADTSYSTMAAGLRMNILRDPGVDKIDFEMWSLVASVIGGCHKCVSSHEQQLIKHEVAKETVQLLAKIAAVINSLSCIQIIEVSK
ncbi:MAG: carboxymuconolactone decarboxylase family protein [Burkholderiales bacterium]|nr:carboxymuconolactone decarboxylase family protein [Burkholderiales bacterium]